MRNDYYTEDYDKETEERKKREENNEKASKALKNGCFTAVLNKDNKYECPECNKEETGTSRHIGHYNYCIYKGIEHYCQQLKKGGTSRKRRTRRMRRTRRRMRRTRRRMRRTRK